MRKRLGFAFFAFVLGCSSPPKVLSPVFAQPDLKLDLGGILDEIKDPSRFNAVNCSAVLTRVLPSIDQERLYKLSLGDLPTFGPQIMDLSFKIRLSLNDRIREIGNCRMLVREAMFRARSLEDLLGEKLYGPGYPMSSHEVSFSKGPAPILDTKTFKGYLAREGYSAGESYEFRAGDLLLEKGNSFISAMLSNAVSPRGHLSHFALVHKDPGTNRPVTIESFIQSGGVAKFEIEEALKKYNVRVVVVRPRDPVAAENMAKMVYDKLEEERKAGRKIPYDFAIDFSDDSQMSCSELVLWGYKKSTGGKTEIPAEFSELNQSMKRILSYVGIKPGKVLTPMDVEVDPNFQLLTEYRDYRLLRESRYRDAIFTQLMVWMKDKGYLLPRKVPVVDVTRMISPMRRSGLPTPRNAKGELEVPLAFIEAIRRTNDVSDILIKQLRDLDLDYQKETGWPMSNARLETELEGIRRLDLVKYESGNPDAFHHLVRPLTTWELIKEIF